MGPPETTIIAIRISLILIWTLVGLRTLLFDWKNNRISRQRIDQAGRWVRASITLMAACVVFFYSPADALLALGHVDQTQRLWLSVAGSVVNCFSGIAALVALDLATNHNRMSLPFYGGILLLPMFWVSMG